MPEHERAVMCHDCGSVVRMAMPEEGSRLVCRRCGATMIRVPVRSLERTLALSLTGIVLLVIAVTTPFISMSMQGRIQNANLLTGALALVEQGLWSLGFLVLLTTLLAPALRLGAFAYVLGGLKLRSPPRDLPLVARWMSHAKLWSMVEVYLLGVFVAYVKLIDLAQIRLGSGFWALVALMLLMVLIEFSFGREVLWREFERRGLVMIPTIPPDAALVACEACGLAAPSPAEGEHGHCPRCGAAIHARKPNAIARAWALSLTALILYIPANVYPVMTVISFGSGSPDTIISGTEELFAAGMWPLALLVFFASITVPVLKIFGLIFLLVSTQLGSARRLRDRTVLYRMVETIGRWSMIDIFMISILVGLVRLGSVATIDTGTGAVAFAAVVVVTMFAASSFDPRLIWDTGGGRHA